MHAFENKSLLFTAKAIILSALERTETRGAHYRSDYPKADEGWLKNVVLTPKGGETGGIHGGCLFFPHDERRTKMLTTVKIFRFDPASDKEPAYRQIRVSV